MVAHVLRLRLQLYANSLRRSVWFALGTLLALLNAVVVVLVTLGAVGFTRRVSDELFESTGVLVGAVLVLGWWVLPLMAFGVDSSLAPPRFATFGTDRRRLLVGMGLAALVGVPGLAAVALVTTLPLLWAERGPTVAGLVVAPLIVAQCVVGSRATTTLLAPLMRTRRFREAAGLMVLVPVAVAGPVVLNLGRALREGADLVPRIVEVVSWTPPGAAWAVPVAVAHEEWGRAGAHLAVAVATTVVLVVVWARGVERVLVSPLSDEVGAKRTHGLGVFAKVPTSPAWAVAARCLTYWVRDVRYVGNLTVLPVVAVALYFLTNGSHTAILLGVTPVVAFTLGWSIAADVAYDNTAFWLHVACGVRGRDDRLGRFLALCVVGLPIIVASAFAAAAVTGRWDFLAEVLGLSLGVFGTSAGLSSVISARFVFAVPRPGDGPLSTPQGSATANLVVQGAAWAVLLVLVAPLVVLAVLAMRGGDVAGWALVVVGPALGAVVAAVGLRLGARLYDAGVPELMQRLRMVG
ncbi:ABC-2 type transport system permease protein [Flavimobilis soli]|uniref:ABC-2 type transport system permease protein n=1 Tax=Flavimobilis soli TaxID=442709 RepID=A0A2A9EB56_9MICO|nr:hypothetical protein [Flavimobilis soli]PFG36178.1 ABC-2 type transport system permease protein [Flavimobilis soli]